MKKSELKEIIKETLKEEANARLIAAAPDLLAACIELIRQFEPFGDQTDGDCGAIEFARSAIAKAEGQPGKKIF